MMVVMGNSYTATHIACVGALHKVHVLSSIMLAIYRSSKMWVVMHYVFFFSFLFSLFDEAPMIFVVMVNSKYCYRPCLVHFTNCCN